MKFAMRLRILQAEVGNPSIRTLCELMSRPGEQYAPSTVHDKLQGMSKPSEEFVRAFVHACASHAGIEIDPQRFLVLHRQMLGELGEFKKATRAAKASSSQYPHGIVIEWTNEGPKVSGDRVLLSPTEMNALVDRWMENLPRFVEQEEAELGKGSWDAFVCGRFLAAIRACGDTYIKVPDESAIQLLSTELARKFSAFWQFIEIMHLQAGLADGTYDDVVPLSKIFGRPGVSAE
jgi:hypothetical protein